MRSLCLLLVSLALACGPFPAGKLSGKPTPLPETWAPLTEGLDGICEVESRASDPHSIQLQCYTHAGKLYVHSHRWARAPWYPVESWAEIWLEEPAVQVRLGDALYSLEAVAVTEPQVRTEVLTSRGYDPVPEGIVLFELRAPSQATADTP